MMGFCGIHKRAISKRAPKILFGIMRLNMLLLKLFSHLAWANKLVLLVQGLEYHANKITATDAEALDPCSTCLVHIVIFYARVHWHRTRYYCIFTNLMILQPKWLSLSQFLWMFWSAAQMSSEHVDFMLFSVWSHDNLINSFIIGSDNSLSPGRRQAIIWTNAGILWIRTLGTNFSEILSEIHAFSFKKMHLKLSSILSRPQCVNSYPLDKTVAKLQTQSFDAHWNPLQKTSNM